MLLVSGYIEHLIASNRKMGYDHVKSRSEPGTKKGGLGRSVLTTGFKSPSEVRIENSWASTEAFSQDARRCVSILGACVASLRCQARRWLGRSSVAMGVQITGPALDSNKTPWLALIFTWSSCVHLDRSLDS